MASPQTSFCTVRLVNIPIWFEHDHLRQLFSAIDQSQIRFWSLATSQLYFNKPSKTGTITFQCRSPDIEALLKAGVLHSSIVSEPENSPILIDETFQGLTPLSEIENDHEAINLIAITGLGGRAFASWQYSDGSMWLRDFLPQDVPELKTFIYGYPSELYKSYSQAGILEHTTSFVNELLNSPVSFKEKPLILVGHSLGCLIIKQALVAHRNKFPRGVYSVVFFGAPNQGLETSALLSLYAGENPERLLRDLTPGSTILTQLHESFISIQPDLKILTCYETQVTPTSVRPNDDPHGVPKRTGKGVMMVPQQSACLYMSNEERIPINLNHSMIAKLSKLPGSAYHTIARHLKMHVQEILGIQKDTEMEGIYSHIFNDKLEERVCKKTLFGQIPDCGAFVGRKEVLNRISEYFESTTSKPSILAIYGLGGAGKSQVASKFSQIYDEMYQSVFWIDCKSQREADQGFTKLAKTFLNEVAVDSLQDSIFPVLSWLEQIPHRWLLIFDNFDDDEFLEVFANRYVPKRGNGDIIITSRLRDSAELGYPINLEMLSEDDAVVMLLNCIGRNDMEESAAARRIVDVLGYLPLAIVQAGSYIKKECIPTDRYLLHYKGQTQELELLGYTNRVSWPYKQSSATTWIVSFQAVEKKNPAAAHWLILCCFLDRNVSQDLFRLAFYKDGQEEGAVNQRYPFPPFLTEVCTKNGDWDELTFHRMTSDIHQYSLMSKSTSLDSSPVLQFHPLVQEVGKLRLSTELQRDFTSLAISLVENAFREPNLGEDLVDDETASYLRQRSLLLHIDACYNNAKRFLPSDLALGSAQSFLAARKFARLYWHEGKWDIAEELQTRALASCSPQNQVFVDITAELAATLRKRGRYDEAASFQRQAIDFATSPEQKLRLLNDLTSTYRDLGNHVEAITLQEQIIGAWGALAGENSRAYIGAQASLAALYYKAGRLTQAASIEEMVLRRRLEDLGENDLSTVRAMDNLATTYWRLERYNEAEILEQGALKTRLKLLGNDHLDTIRSMGHLSATFRKQGRLSEAFSLIQEVLGKKRALLGKNNPSTVLTAKHLYKTLVALRRESEAAIVRCEYGLRV